MNKIEFPFLMAHEKVDAKFKVICDTFGNLLRSISIKNIWTIIGAALCFQVDWTKTLVLHGNRLFPLSHNGKML